MRNGNQNHIRNESKAKVILTNGGRQNSRKWAGRFVVKWWFTASHRINQMHTPRDTYICRCYCAPRSLPCVQNRSHGWTNGLVARAESERKRFEWKVLNRNCTLAPLLTPWMQWLKTSTTKCNGLVNNLFCRKMKFYPLIWCCILFIFHHFPLFYSFRVAPFSPAISAQS